MSADYIYAATAAKYGDPLGPTYDMLAQNEELPGDYRIRFQTE